MRTDILWVTSLGKYGKYWVEFHQGITEKKVDVSTNLSVTYLSLSSLKFEVAKHSEILMCVNQAGQERLSTVVKQKSLSRYPQKTHCSVKLKNPSSDILLKSWWLKDKGRRKSRSLVVFMVMKFILFLWSVRIFSDSWLYLLGFWIPGMWKKSVFCLSVQVEDAHQVESKSAVVQIHYKVR